MNPLPLIGAELRHNRLGCAAVVAMIAVAVALGAALSAQERALSLASAHAVAQFDAVVGTAGAPSDRINLVQDMLRSVTFAFDGLLVTAVLLVIVAVLSARRQSIGALRALGAPPAFVFVTVWLQGALLITAGVLLGMGLAVPLAKAIGAIAGEELGLVVDATIGLPELARAAVFSGAGSLFAAAPSLPMLRVPVPRLLRDA